VRHASRRSSHFLLGVVTALAVVAPGNGFAVPLVGNAQTVVRDVLGVIATDERTIYVDSDVFQDEEIVTAAKSATRIIFKDGTNLEMGENSRLKLTKLVFDPDPSKSKVAVKAVIGVFRWTSGNLPHEAYQIGTPVATIGIRGTTLEYIVGESGLTTVALARGAVVVGNLKGESVDLKPGEATTVLPPDADGNQAPPSDPGPLAADLQNVLWAMTVMIRSADPPSDIDPSAGGTGPSSGNANNFNSGNSGFGFGGGGATNPDPPGITPFGPPSSIPPFLPQQFPITIAGGGPGPGPRPQIINRLSRLSPGPASNSGPTSEPTPGPDSISDPTPSSGPTSGPGETAISEPWTLALFGFALGGLAVVRRLRL
jgi:FecR-like protein